MSADRVPPPAPPRPPAPPPALAAEPSLALKNVLGLRAEADLPEAWHAPLHDLARMVQERKAARAPLPEWLPAYEHARDVVSGALAELDTRIAAATTRVPSSDELARTQAGRLAEPRKDAEALRTRLRSEVRRVADEWKARAQRQLDQHLREPTVQASLAGLELRADKRNGTLVLELGPGWIDRFRGYLDATCATWTDQLARDLDHDLAAAVADASALPLAAGRAVEPPRARPAAAPAATLYGAPEPKTVPVPTRGEQVGRSLRSGMMLARFLGGLVVTLGGGAVAIGALFGEGGDDNRELLGLGGAALVLLVTPLVLWSAWKEAAREVAQLEAREVAAYRAAAERWVKETVGTTLDRHRERLQRHVVTTSAAWEAAVDAWFDQAVAPALREREAAATRELDAAREAAARLTAELNALRTLRGTLASQLKAVKVRLQEILDESQ